MQWGDFARISESHFLLIDDVRVACFLGFAEKIILHTVETFRRNVFTIF